MYLYIWGVFWRILTFTLKSCVLNKHYFAYFLKVEFITTQTTMCGQKSVCFICFTCLTPGELGPYLSVHCGNNIRGYFEDGFSTIDPFHIRSILFHSRGIKRERKSPKSCSSITSGVLLFLPFTPFFFFSVLVTLVLLASLIAKYPGGRLHETGMLNSWDDRRPSLSRGSHE